MNRLFSLVKIVFLVFILLIITSVIYILISSLYWKLELTNETNNDVIFESEYCPNSDSKLTIRKYSTKSFYCFDTDLICREYPKKICVENLGCDVYSHTDCDGHIGPFLESVKNINISTSDLIYDTELQWEKRIRKSTKQEILFLLKQKSKNLYFNNSILKYVNDSLKEDKEVVLAAIKFSKSELENADGTLKNDRHFILTALKSGYMIFSDVSKVLKMDRLFVLEAGKSNPKILIRLIEEDGYYTNDKETLLVVIKNRPSVFRYANIELRSNKEFVVNAIKANKDAFHFLEVNFKTDSDILKLIE